MEVDDEEGSHDTPTPRWNVTPLLQQQQQQQQRQQPATSDLTIGLERIRMIVERAIVSGEKYPIRLDDVWRLIAYSSKQAATIAITDHFISGTIAFQD
jgi:hypothetical protein